MSLLSGNPGLRAAASEHSNELFFGGAGEERVANAAHKQTSQIAGVEIR